MELILVRRQLIIFLLVIVFVVNKIECFKRIKRIVGGIEAAKPPEDDPVVFVDENNRNSRVYGARDPDKGFYVFKGIRYGEPPVGRNRFQVNYIDRYYFIEKIPCNLCNSKNKNIAKKKKHTF